MKTLLRLLLSGSLLALSVAHGAPPPLNIVFIPKSSDQVFWDLMRGGVDQAVAEEGNISLTWRGPAYNQGCSLLPAVNNTCWRAEEKAAR